MPQYKITTTNIIDCQPDNIVPYLDEVLEKLRKIGLIASVEQVKVDKLPESNEVVEVTDGTSDCSTLGGGEDRQDDISSELP